MRLLLLGLALLSCSRATEPPAYPHPERSDQCEATAQTVSACPSLTAEPCQAFWDAYDQCMTISTAK